MGKKLIENIGEIKNFEKTVQEKTKPFGKRKQYPISFLFLKKKLFFKKKQTPLKKKKHSLKKKLEKNRSKIYFGKTPSEKKKKF